MEKMEGWDTEETVSLLNIMTHVGGPDQRGSDQRGSDKRGPDQRGPDQRGSDQRGPN